jgi:hypothetical protein
MRMKPYRVYFHLAIINITFFLRVNRFDKESKNKGQLIDI